MSDPRKWMDLTSAQIRQIFDDEGVPLSGNVGRKDQFAVFAEKMFGPDPDHPVLVVPGDSGYVPTVHEAMLEVMRKVRPIAKDARNTQSHYAARSIDDVMDELHGIMAEAGVLPVPEVEHATYERNGKQQEAILRVRWKFTGARGDECHAVVYGEALDSSDKATNKALQASLKYTLLDVFLIPVGEQDADTVSPEREDPPERISQEDAAAIGLWLREIPEGPDRERVREEVRKQFGSASEMLLDSRDDAIEWIRRRMKELSEAAASDLDGEVVCQSCEGTGLHLVQAPGEEAREVTCVQCGGAKVVCVECSLPLGAHAEDCSRRPL